MFYDDFYDGGMNDDYYGINRRSEETLDWLLPKFHGLIIGQKGATIKGIREQSGATIKIEKDDGRCSIHGTYEQREVAKAMIREKISEREQRDHVKRPSTRRDETSSGSGNWKHVDFVKQEMLGCVIGKGGATIKRFETDYSVKLRTQGGKLFILGELETDTNRKALEGLKELLGLNANKVFKASIGEDGWEVIRHFNSKYIGVVFGTKGCQLKKHQDTYKIEIRIVSEGNLNYIAIKGDDEASKEKFNIFLRSITVQNRYKYHSGFKKTFGIGNLDQVQIVLEESSFSALQSMRINDDGGEQSSERSYENIPGLKKDLLSSFTSAKSKINNGAVCDYMVHCGKMYSTKKPGIYQMSELAKESLVYQRLGKQDLDLEKIEQLPKIREVFRYDLSIYTPEPQLRIRYKIFLKKNDDGRLVFITCGEAGVREMEFYQKRVGPGYFSLPDERLARMDVVDPQTSHTSRINIQVFSMDEEFDSTMKTHTETLSSSFFEKIKVEQPKILAQKTQMEIKIPELPAGYVISYMRRSVRNTYRFAGSNLLRTSEENVFINKEAAHDTNKSDDDIIDVFFISENMNELLETEDWEPEQVVDEMESVLKFSDTMMQYLAF